MRKPLLLALLLSVAACSDAPSGAPVDGGAADGGTGDGGAASACAGQVCSTCFLHGVWQLDNLSPCIVSGIGADGGLVVSGAVSSMLSNHQVSCPASVTTRPAEPWSTDALRTDCPGSYVLCLTLKAGAPQSPSASDCTIAQTCAPGTYLTAGQLQTWAPLPSWLASSDAQRTCAGQFSATGGYAELSVSGCASGCGSVARVFGRIRYCPLSCNANPSGPQCTGCQDPDGGSF